MNWMGHTQALSVEGTRVTRGIEEGRLGTRSALSWGKEEMKGFGREEQRNELNICHGRRIWYPGTEEKRGEKDTLQPWCEEGHWVLQ